MIGLGYVNRQQKIQTDPDNPSTQMQQPGTDPVPMDVKNMMYKGSGNSITPNTYRLERGFAYTRRGIVQPPIPQFKGLYLYSLSATAVQQSFQQTLINKNGDTYQTRVRWPIPPSPASPSGS